MSKDFEQAYKELANRETPDLWDRIEAGLSEKSAPEKREEHHPKEKKKIYFRKYAGMAAAVLCVVLILPAAVFLRQQGQKSSNYEMAADSSAPEESGGMMEECAPEAAEGAQADGTAFDAAAGGAENAADTAADADMAVDVRSAGADADAGEAGSEDTLENAAVVEESVLDYMREEDKKMESSSDSAASEYASAPKQSGVAELEDGAVIEKVTVDVLEGTSWLDGSESAQSIGTVYTAVVVKDESGCLEEGEEIEILVPAYSSFALIEGKTFEIDLLYREKEKYPFELKVIR